VLLIGTENTISPLDELKMLEAFLLVAVISSSAASEKKVICDFSATYF
jgi:hypothetical protein